MLVQIGRSIVKEGQSFEKITVSEIAEREERERIQAEELEKKEEAREAKKSRRKRGILKWIYEITLHGQVIANEDLREEALISASKEYEYQFGWVCEKN